MNHEVDWHWQGSYSTSNHVQESLLLPEINATTFYESAPFVHKKAATK
jgi:hypothetical protein